MTTTTNHTASTDARTILLHGWGGSSQAVWFDHGWREALASAGLEPIGIDLIGHGTAQRPHDPQDYADLAAKVIEQLPGDATGLLGLGYSLGCKVLLEIEARQPGRFSRLVLGGLGGNAFAPEKGGETIAQCLEHGPNADTPPMVKVLADYGVSNGNDPLALAAILRRPPNPLLTPERLRAVRCPVLLVCGDADALAYPVGPLADALPDAAVEILPGIDHLQLPPAARFRQTAVAFLRAGRATEGAAVSFAS